ncbi:hypothetical protein JXA70_09645 [candidate division KSB1 bacterium]|nr:hypothetical protein [candidate division KSB1 bacterium]
MKKTFDICKVILFCAILYACAWSETQTNLEVLEQQYYAIFSEILSEICIADSQCFVEQPENGTSYAWLVNKQLYKVLKESGVRQIYTQKQSDNFMHVTYKTVAQIISYDKINNKQLKRIIDTEIYLHIADAHKRVVTNEHIKKTYTDTVQKSQIQTIENIHFTFTKGEQKKSWFSAIYEPLIVTTVTGLIIFLFYSYRSQ